MPCPKHFHQKGNCPMPDSHGPFSHHPMRMQQLIDAFFRKRTRQGLKQLWARSAAHPLPGPVGKDQSRFQEKGRIGGPMSRPKPAGLPRISMPFHERQRDPPGKQEENASGPGEPSKACRNGREHGISGHTLKRRRSVSPSTLRQAVYRPRRPRKNGYTRGRERCPW